MRRKTKDLSARRLKAYYTNADQLLNKMIDLKAHIHEREADVIIITEVIPKAQANPIPQVRLQFSM